MAADKPAEVFEDVFEEGEPQEAQTIHRIRANSTIMQLKKILGKSFTAGSKGTAGRGRRGDLVDDSDKLRPPITLGIHFTLG